MIRFYKRDIESLTIFVPIFRFIVCQILYLRCVSIEILVRVCDQLDIFSMKGNFQLIYKMSAALARELLKFVFLLLIGSVSNYYSCFFLEVYIYDFNPSTHWARG